MGLKETRTISILGCGWLGEPLAKELLKQGFEIKGSTTSKEKLKRFSEVGIKPYLIKMDDEISDLSNFLVCEILIIAITSKNIQGFTYLKEQIDHSNISKVLFISSTSVYPLPNDWVTESTPVLDTPLAKIERLLNSSNQFNTTILRLAGLISEDRHPGNFFRNGKVIRDPENFVNMIHREDCIAIIKQLIFHDLWGNVYNACADAHPSKREYYGKLINEYRNELPVFEEGNSFEWKKVSNAKIKSVHNYQFIHPHIFYE
ncbi:NAD(P)-binding domain-containing protein [Namhaeicola litoreus]|uniref:NAD(P)-binding domain-containing protein n=1 Tax=Namhaeicola litoreus TaxID=1052145 RepID=A0ABW3Y2I6_9FLAO